MPKTCMKMIIVSNSPLITICGMWSQFLDSGVVIFLHLKMATFGDFGCKKMGLRTPEYKNGDHFLSTLPNICYLPILFATSLGYVSRDVSTKIWKQHQESWSWFKILFWGNTTKDMTTERTFVKKETDVRIGWNRPIIECTDPYLTSNLFSFHKKRKRKRLKWWVITDNTMFSKLEIWKVVTQPWKLPS